ncbi:hypothetical protein FRC11_009228 [Ceratobasidium sp. 423]|nr:hypothetical protein FRC11_009228 [Ceratobasidium sp. 423]
MTNQSTANDTAATVIDHPMDVAQSPTVAGDDPGDESRVEELQSSQVDAPSLPSVEELYPALKEAPSNWQSTFCEIADLPTHNFITDGTNSEATRSLTGNNAEISPDYSILLFKLYLNLRAYRPLLPPPHPNAMQCTWVFDNFIWLYHVWQGKQNLPWATFAATQQTDTLAIAPACYAPGIDWNFHITEWPVAKLDRAYSYQLHHQSRVGLGDADSMAHMFQWVVEHVDKPYQLEPIIGPEGLLVYGDEAAAYFLANKRHSFPDDTYIQPSAEPRKWFTQEVMQVLASEIEPDMEELIFWMEVNEKRNPLE